MREILTAAIAASAMMVNANNPFYNEFKTLHTTPPFNEIKTEHFEEAVMRGINLAKEEINTIANNPEPPTFENTIVALDRAGADLTRVLNVFFPLTSSMSDEAMMTVQNNVMPALSEYSTSITLNEPLWKRVKSVYENRNGLSLNPEDEMLLQQTYESFAHSGADLQGDDRETYRKLTAELSELTTRFGQNVLRELNNCEMWLTADDLDGLPADLINEAAASAKERNRDGEYRFSFDAPVYMQFMKYSSRRDLREKMYRAYSSRNLSGDYNNVPVMERIAEIRRQIAKLLGSETYATHSTRHTMAQNPGNVMKLLTDLRDAYRPALTAEMQELTDFASKIEKNPMEIKPWDYSYYSNKLKKEKYSYDEEAMRPYFQLDSVIDGVFGLATKLYGITFTPNSEIQVYHPDVKAFEVNDRDGKFIGVIYTDFFPRSTKRSGAWMTNFSEQFVDKNGVDHRPQVTIVMNFTKPTANKPSLLTPYEVETFLHEFGHALHGLLSECKYTSLSGTNVYRDFVELPSQFNENYLTEKEFLDSFAHHYQTGEAIPSEMIDKLVKSSQYGAAYSCMRQLMFGMIDMGWHNNADQLTDDAATVERKAIESVAIFPPVEGTMVSPTFGHIFSGGYAAGYYSYKWAEVLDADAFAAFKEKGIFDPETAASFRENILSKGGTVNPAELYRRFRGHEPTIDALLIRDGIKKPAPKKDTDLHHGNENL